MSWKSLDNFFAYAKYTFSLVSWSVSLPNVKYRTLINYFHIFNTVFYNISEMRKGLFSVKYFLKWLSKSGALISAWLCISLSVQTYLRSYKYTKTKKTLRSGRLEISKFKNIASVKPHEENNLLLSLLKKKRPFFTTLNTYKFIL